MKALVVGSGLAGVTVAEALAKAGLQYRRIPEAQMLRRHDE